MHGSPQGRTHGAVRPVVRCLAGFYRVGTDGQARRFASPRRPTPAATAANLPEVSTFVLPEPESPLRTPGTPTHSELCSIKVFCGDCNCGCPELFLDPQAEDTRRIVLADDFGQRVQMSVEQLGHLVRDAKSGALDELIERGSAH